MHQTAGRRNNLNAGPVLARNLRLGAGFDVSEVRIAESASPLARLSRNERAECR